MCGLVGVLGTLKLRDERAFEDLLIVDAVRGLDSTGVSVVTTTKENFVVKGAMSATDLLCSREYKNATARMLRIMMGHNRAATKGSVSHVNAHPFVAGDIVGMHNGTLNNVWNLEDGHKFATDSEAIFNTINIKGIEHTWKQVDGAAALVWYDKKANTMSFLRNSQRPLYFAFTKDNKAMFWASERWMLVGIAARHTIELNTIYYPEPNFMFTHRISRAGNIVQEAKELEPFRFTMRTHIQKGKGDTYPFRDEFATQEEYLDALVAWRKKHPSVWDKTYDEDTTPNNVTELKPAKLNKRQRKRQARLLKAAEEEAKEKGGDKDDDLPFAFAEFPEEKDFHEQYSICCFCRESLADEYWSAQIVDATNASCDKCVNDINDKHSSHLSQGVLGW